MIYRNNSTIRYAETLQTKVALFRCYIDIRGRGRIYNNSSFRGDPIEWNTSIGQSCLIHRGNRFDQVSRFTRIIIYRIAADALEMGCIRASHKWISSYFQWHFQPVLESKRDNFECFTSASGNESNSPKQTRRSIDRSAIEHLASRLES